LNDRFYRYLEFGTGGMRGRTVGVTPAKAETGHLDPRGAPEHAAIGSNLLNDFTLIRAVVGLFRYTKKYLAEKKDPVKPRLVIANDVSRAGVGFDSDHNQVLLVYPDSTVSLPLASKYELSLQLVDAITDLHLKTSSPEN